jgi:hypothetical protein
MGGDEMFIIADGTCALDANFYYGRGLWGTDRQKVKLYDTEAGAQKVAANVDSTVWEVEIPHDGFRPFTVKAWAQ